MTHEYQTTPAPVEVRDTRLTRPIVGIKNRTAQEVFDIMCDRIAHSAPAGEVEPVAWMYDGGGSAYAVFVTRSDWRVRAGWTETPLYTHPAPPADVVEAVKHAIFVFDTYAENHAAKGTAEGKLKAERNRQEAGRLRQALAKHGGA